MPSLRDLMADDLTNVLLDEEAFAEACTFTPQEPNATAFPVVLAVGDVTDQMLAIASGRADQAQIGVTGKRSVLRAGIQANTTEAVERDPIHGDLVTFPATSEYAGTWSVMNPQPDQGGGVTMTLRFEQRHDVSAQDAQENR